MGKYTILRPSRMTVLPLKTRCMEKFYLIVIEYEKLNRLFEVITYIDLSSN